MSPWTWAGLACVAVMLLVIVSGVGMCLYHHEDIVAGRFTCDAHDKLMELMGWALSAVLMFQRAFEGGGR